jgi:LPXTG-motif cell wall-anchored protein
LDCVSFGGSKCPTVASAPVASADDNNTFTILPAGTGPAPVGSNSNWILILLGLAAAGAVGYYVYKKERK